MNKIVATYGVTFLPDINVSHQILENAKHRIKHDDEVMKWEAEKETRRSVGKSIVFGTLLGLVLSKSK